MAKIEVVFPHWYGLTRRERELVCTAYMLGRSNLLEVPHDMKHPVVPSIDKALYELCGVDLQTVLSSGRMHTIIDWKYAVILWLYRVCKYRLTDIKEVFQGYLTYSTILHGCRQAEAWYECDKGFRAKYLRFEEVISKYETDC